VLYHGIISHLSLVRLVCIMRKFKLMGYSKLLYRHKCFTGKTHTKPHPGLEWHIFHILTRDDIDDFTAVMFVS